MSNVGYATLQIIPSVRGIGDELRRQLVGPAGDAGNRAGESAGGGFGDAFKGALAAIGLTEVASKIGEQFVEAFNQSIEQANVTSTLQAQLGASGKDAAKYGAEVGRLYAKGVTDNFEQGAEAIRAVVSGGLIAPGATTKQLDVIATKMTDVANVFGTGMGLQTQAISALMKNKLAPDAGAALDVITSGLQNLGPLGDDLLETFQEYPVQLRKLGLDAKTSLGLFQQGLQGGARDTDIIADALKEFSIRSIDMSDSSRAAYKSLGLDAKTMEEQIGKGGASAQSGLQTVLDKLRSIHDPVKREAAAVGLFGTQAEDAGQALFKLDPSKASKAFGDVSGAASKLGDTLRSGPAYEITVFKRALQQGLVTFIGGKVLPILSEWGVVLNDRVLPPIVTVGGVLSSLFLPTLSVVGSVLASTIGWFREWGIWLVPLAIAVGGVTLALNAQAIATGIVTAVFSVYRAAILVGTAVTNGFAGAQALLNAVMALNPFVLIAIAVIALGAALVIAYKKSDTFRRIVQAAWAGIQVAALWAWNNVLKPIFAALVVAFKEVATWALWLWKNALSPVIGWIVAGFKLWWTGVKIYVTAVSVIFVLLAGVAMWLWRSAISPVIGWIVAGFKLWWAGVKLYVSFAMAIFRAAGAAAVWLWQKAISPVIGWIVAGFKLWWAGVKLYFGLFKTGVQGLGAAGMWLWKNALQPAFRGIATVAKWLYDKGIKPPIELGKKAAHALGDAFSAAKDMIGHEFGKIADLAKKPIEFVINTVYNRGIVGVWNKVAGAFGAPKLAKFKGFAVGGPVRGGGTETSDSILARLSRNEHVWTAKEVRGAGGHGAVMALRRRAASGNVLPGFKDGGGLFGWIGSAGSALKGAGSKAWDLAKSGASWLKDTLAGSARAGINAIVKPLLSKIPGLNSGFGKMVADIPSAMIDALTGYAKKADDKGASASVTAAGGGSLGKWIAKAMGLTGVPASWAGPLRTLIMRESGGNPKAINLTDSNAKAGHPSQGLMQTIPSTFAAYRLKSLPNVITDPIANIVAGIRYILSRYGSIFNVQQAVGATPKGYAGGGSPRPGEIAWVGENGPELMRFHGGEVIYSNAESMRMAAGMGGLRGFAKGTSRAAARKQVPGDLTVFLKALTGSASDIRKAAKALAVDLKAAGGAGKALASSTSKASIKLQALAKQRDSVASKLAEAKQAASDQKKVASDFLSISNLGDATSIGDVLSGLRTSQGTVTNFENQIATLSKKGLNQSLISQLVGMGPDSQLAGLISRATPGQIKQLNALAKSGAKLSTAFGRTTADAMFDSGKDAGLGFLTGLQSQEKALQKQITKLGDGLVKAIRKALDSHSPSRKTAAVGEDVGAGLAVGMDATASQVAAAAVRMADAAVPSVSASSSSGSASGGFAAGQRLRLVVGDREFDAYVEDIADQRVSVGLTKVRRRVEAGNT